MIFAYPPMVLYNGSSVCVMFEEGDRKGSLALDNSCSSDRTKKLRRGSLALFEVSGGSDIEVTRQVFSDLAHEEDPDNEFLEVHSSMEHFMRAMIWLTDGNTESCSIADSEV